MKLVAELVAATMLVAWFIDFLVFHHERKMVKRRRAGETRRWWNDREDGPEGDH